MKEINKSYIISGVFLLVALILIVFLIYPTFQDVQDSSSQIAATKQQIALLDAQNLDLVSFKENYPGYKNNLDTIENLFVDPNNPVDFIKFLEGSADNANLNSDISIVNASGNNPSNPQPLIFEVITKGNLKNILNFSEKIEQGPYLLTIQNVTLRKVNQLDNSGKVIGSSFSVDFLINVITD